MSATNGAGRGTHHARPMILLRYRPGLAGESARTVHLAPLPPDGQGAVSALCGALLRPGDTEAVPPGHGMPCSQCVLRHALTGPGPQPPAGTGDSALPYRDWGWPVTADRERVWLDVDGEVVALLVPTPLATKVVMLLLRRRCAPAVLAQPSVPEHQVVLAGERFDTALPWPPEVHRVHGALLLPPARTAGGPVTWVRRPGAEALRCREIDVLSALLAVLRDPPPPGEPTHF